MKKLIPILKVKMSALSPKEIMAARGIKCAGWVAGIRQGGDLGKSEGDLYSFIIKKMTAIAMGFLHDNLQAKAAFSKAWEFILGEINNGNYKEQNTFEAYCGRIISNICRKIIKEAARFIALDSEVDMPNPEVEASRFSDEMKIKLACLMKGFTLIMQDKITMHYVDDVSWKIIGAKYKVSAATVRSEVSKKMKELKKKLGG